MVDELVGFELAVLAKEKGFDIPVFRWYYSINGLNGKEDSSTMGKSFYKNHSKRGKLYYSAPTQSLLQRWLRETKGIYVSPMFIGPDTNKHRCRIDVHGSGQTGHYTQWFETHEEALEFGLKTALNNII